MADPDPTPHITPLQFWSGIITVLASTIILPAFNMWIASQHETNRVQDNKAVIANQAETHAALSEAVEKQKELTTTVASVQKNVLAVKKEVVSPTASAPVE